MLINNNLKHVGLWYSAEMGAPWILPGHKIKYHTQSSSLSLWSSPLTSSPGHKIKYHRQRNHINTNTSIMRNYYNSNNPHKQSHNCLIFFFMFVIFHAQLWFPISIFVFWHFVSRRSFITPPTLFSPEKPLCGHTCTYHNRNEIGS